MSTDADSVPAPKPRAPNAPAVAKKKKKGPKRKIVRPLTEPEIDAPDIQTLVMVGVLAALALVLWAFAHAGCNYHPPRETRRPRDVTTAELTREPKDAAIEFQHRLITLNHKGALEIAAGPLAEEVKKSLADCDANKTACAAKKQGMVQAITAAVVLERGPMNAKVRVTSYRLPTGDQTYLALVERDPSGWKVTAHVPDAPGATLPPPSFTPAQSPPRFDVAPADSANPATIRPAQPSGAAPRGAASSQPIRLAPSPTPSARP